jgi:hypothetical protein
MEPAPFELRECQRVEGGIRLLFRCSGCRAETGVVVKDDDPLEGKFHLRCACGAEINLVFGSPLVGRALLRSIRKAAEPSDALHRCPSVLLN